MADSDSQVIIYSAEWCAFCHSAKAYLDKKGVKYAEKDVDSDRSIAEEAMKVSGQTGIPVISINGNVIIGFDRPRIDSALASANL
jgi:glutaredoxin 3